MKKVTFRKDVGDLRLMAIYCQKLTELGLEFEIKEYGNQANGEYLEVHLTGGY